MKTDNFQVPFLHIFPSHFPYLCFPLFPSYFPSYFFPSYFPPITCPNVFCSFIFLLFTFTSFNLFLLYFFYFTFLLLFSLFYLSFFTYLFPFSSTSHPPLQRTSFPSSSSPFLSQSPYPLTDLITPPLPLPHIPHHFLPPLCGRGRRKGNKVIKRREKLAISWTKTY